MPQHARSRRLLVQLVAVPGVVLALLFAGLVAPGAADAAPKARPRVAVKASASKVVVNKAVLVTVTVRRGAARQPVFLQQRVGKRWSTVRATNLTRRGSITATYRLKVIRLGTVLYRVRVGATKPPTPPAPPVKTGSFEAIHAIGSDQTATADHAAKIRATIDTVSQWFGTQTIGGAVPRFVRTETGDVSVREVKLGLTTAQLATATSDQIETALRAKVPVVADRKVIAFVDAPRSDALKACGNADTGGDFALIIEKNCSQAATGSPWPGGTSYGVAHKMGHLFGGVASCAPHYSQNAHVGAPANDLMAEAPPADPTTVQLDPGHDDYYGHSNPNCIDIADSAWWLTPAV